MLHPPAETVQEDPDISGQRRGRPPGRIAELAASDGQVFNPEPRIGWLLRSNRLACLPGVSARQFAVLLADHGVPADPSRVSRWETGLVPATLEVVAAYERLIDLDPGGLRGVALFQRRVGTGQLVSASNLAGLRDDPAHLERVLDAVVDGEPDGCAWFELGLAVASVGERMVLPQSLWRSLTNRLVRQVGISVGSAYLGRVEAANLLTTHASARNALAYSIGEMLTEADVPVVTDPMTILQEIDTPQANGLVLRLLDQEQISTRSAAAWAAAVKLGRGHFDEQEAARLEALVMRLARTHGLERGGSFSGLLDLVDVLSPAARAVILNAAGEVRGEPAAQELAPDLQEVTAVLAQVVEEADVDDPMLERLVWLALADPRAEHRFLAVFTLQQSPFRALLARVAGRRIEAHLSGADPVQPELAHRLMVVLSVVGTPAEADLLLRIAEDNSSPLRGMGLIAVAHLPPGASVRRPRLERLLEGPDESLARTAAYCAGMTGDPALRRLMERDDVPLNRRRAAQWWIAHGPAIHEAQAGRRPDRS
ncbi:hypothetical protein [Nocardioides mesophilus]|uniref:Uncharacterized protein n=1 Tax=Nocardioides mesophilus TaxID=433659 RepID=A0A7G9RFV4_9ACTN|nr:hypothetical protein [Nocardioides mesophilus]QNN54479.1 hypothetical protein H9L09_09300 [Nocardioides mesophilus]